MSKRTSIRSLTRLKRQQRVRAQVKGTTERPRLCVYRSNRHVYAQIIDDKKGATLAAVGTLSEEYRKLDEKVTGKKAAFAVGQLLAKKCADVGVKMVVFDRNGFIYTKNGLVASLAAGARKGGLDF